MLAVGRVGRWVHAIFSWLCLKISEGGQAVEARKASGVPFLKLYSSEKHVRT